MDTYNSSHINNDIKNSSVNVGASRISICSYTIFIIIINIIILAESSQLQRDRQTENVKALDSERGSVRTSFRENIILYIVW